MAHKVRSNVCEVSTSEGTDDYLLAGPITTYDAFDFLDNGDTTFFHAKATDGSADWEEGIATKVTGGLERTTILASSNGGSKVDWPDTTPKRIVCGQPASAALAVGEVEILATTNVGGTASKLITNLAAFEEIVVTVDADNNASVRIRSGAAGVPASGGSDYRFANQTAGNASSDSSAYVTSSSGHHFGKCVVTNLGSSGIKTGFDANSMSGSASSKSMAYRNSRVAEDCLELTPAAGGNFLSNTFVRVTGRLRRGA